jgi:hypothetical protein
MIGYWSSDNPVKAEHAEVLATVYAREDKALISLASWAEGDVGVKLTIDWDSLGLDPEGRILTAPFIPEFQEAGRFHPNETIPVAQGRGWLLILETDKD